MSYNNYNEQSSYGQMNPYAQQDNRYDPPQQGGYDRPQGGHQDPGYSSRYGDEEQGHEMQALNGQSSGRDPNAILNECREIDKGIDRIQGNLDQLRRIQDVSVRDTNTDPKSTTNRDLDALNADTITLYRSFVSRMKVIKSNPESGNPRNSAQVGRVDRRLKDMINAYQQVERDYRRKVQESRERSYRIVRPDASDAEVREAMEEPANSQIFSQALYSSDRRGQAQSALENVRDRHKAIEDIEKTMIQLAGLFQDLEASVVMQEPAVTQIEQKGEEVNDNVGKANVEIDGAISKARSRNRKKWWCLLIILLIIIIVVVVVVVVKEVNKTTK